MTTPNNNSLNTIATNLYGDTQILNFNFPTINTNEMFKKQDGDNITGTKIYSTGTSNSNKITMTSDASGLINVGTLEGERDIILNTSKLHVNATGTQTDGITITSQGRVGIGVTDPQEDLELDGNIQLDTGGVQRGRVIFNDKQNNHKHAEIDGLGEGTNGGVLVFYTKEDLGNVTEKLRINNVGAIGIGGANYGTAGQVLVSNGSAALPSWQIPYHLVFRLADSGGGSIFVTTAATTVVYNTLYVVTGESPTTTYNTDLVSSTTWNPSVSGIFQINFHALIRSVNQDFLVESTISIQKLVSGSWSNVAGSNDRRWGASVNEADARAFTNTNTIAHSFNVSSGDSFRFTINGRSYLGNNIWTLTGQDAFRISITRIA